jgi:hypothetical protein
MGRTPMPDKSQADLARIEGGDHSFKPRMQSERTWAQSLGQQAAAEIVGLLASLTTERQTR